MNAFPLVFTLCIDIVLQRERINSLLGMSVRYCDPTVSHCEGKLFYTLLLLVGTFMMQMAWVWLFFVLLYILHVFFTPEVKSVCAHSQHRLFLNYAPDSLKVWSKMFWSPRLQCLISNDGCPVLVSPSEGSWGNFIYCDGFDPLALRGEWEASDERAKPGN